MGYVGIDVSKRHLDMAVLGEDGSPAARRFPNTAEGVGDLVGAVAGCGAELVVVESTGAYHRAALAALSAAALPVALVNPIQVAAFRRTLLGRNKTDASDAALLARFGRTYADQLRPYDPPGETRERLVGLLGYREGLVGWRTRLLGQLEAARRGGGERLVELLEARLADAVRCLREADAELAAALAGIPESRVLLGVRGVGPAAAAAVLAYLPEGVLGDAKAAACYAGVHPAVEASGQAYRSRMSKRGSGRLRRYLYMAALAATVWNPELKAYYERLVARGKAKRQALGAVMHKLLRQLMGKLNDHRNAAPPRAT